VNTVACKLVTIVAEDELEDRLLKDLDTLGARGYTICKVRGKGIHRTRTSEWEGENILIETLVSEDVASTIMSRLEQAYFPHFGVTAFIVNVEVVRGPKYA